MSAHRIHPVDLMSRKTADTCIVDVRTAAEVKAAGLPDCLHIPLHELTRSACRRKSPKVAKRQLYLFALPGRAPRGNGRRAAGRQNQRPAVHYRRRHGGGKTIQH